MSRTAELTAKLLDGSLSEGEWDELDALITSDPVAQGEYLQLLEVEAALRGLRTDLDIVDAALAKVKETQAEKTADAVLAEIATAPLPAWRPRAALATQPSPSRRRAWLGLAGLLACA